MSQTLSLAIKYWERYSRYKSLLVDQNWRDLKQNSEKKEKKKKRTEQKRRDKIKKITLFENQGFFARLTKPVCTPQTTEMLIKPLTHWPSGLSANGGYKLKPSQQRIFLATKLTLIRAKSYFNWTKECTNFSTGCLNQWSFTWMILKTLILKKYKTWHF